MSPLPSQAPLRVLVVDDYKDEADSLAMVLREWGHEATVAYDGATAVAVARAQQPDVVLLDLALPGQDGLAVARQLRQEWTTVQPILIAVTGYTDESFRQRAAEAGIVLYFTKPLDLTTLEQLLGSLRDRKGDQPLCEAPT